MFGRNIPNAPTGSVDKQGASSPVHLVLYVKRQGHKPHPIASEEEGAPMAEEWIQARMLADMLDVLRTHAPRPEYLIAREQNGAPVEA